MLKTTTRKVTALLLALTMIFTLGIVAGADDTTEDITRNADVSSPSDGNVLVSISGSAAMQSEKQELLDVLNTLRKEACDNGYPNPEDPSVALTSDDYVPLTWNTDLEDIAQLRAAEGVLEESNTRPNGKYGGTIMVNGTLSHREDIGWAWSKTAEGAELTDITSLFYGYTGDGIGENSEIALWRTGNYTQDNTAVAHYANLINPAYRSVGSAMFFTSDATIATSAREYTSQNVLCVVQEMSRDVTSEEKQEFSQLGGDYTQIVEAGTSYLSEMYFDNAYLAMETGERELLVPSAKLKAGRNSNYAYDIYLPNCHVTSGASWSSSNTGLAVVNSRGRVGARSAGTVTVTAKAGSCTAEQQIQITGEDVDLPEDDVLDRFEDVVATKWYAPGVEYCVTKGIMSGISDTVFDVSGSVNRAMVVTTLWAMEGKPEPTGNKSFSDIPDGRYFTKAVQWAAEKELVSGYTTGEYQPFTAVSRQQLVTILYQYARYKNWDSDANASLLVYTDIGEISGYAVLPFRWAVGHGLISGRSSTTLAPRDTVTRAEIATILMRFDETINPNS